MQDLLVSLNKNVIRLSTVDKNTALITALVDVPGEVANDTRITDPKAFSDILNALIPQVSTLSKNKLSLNVVLEPKDVYLRFITVSKKEEDLDEQIIAEIKEKAKDIPLEDVYYSYKKIAPFVYQFVGVSKEILEKYLEVSSSLGIGLKSVIPWVLALPKYEKVNEPAIFLAKVGDRQVIALSELNGVFFSDVFEKEKKETELQPLIKDLSFYKRSSPISHIITLNCDPVIGGYEMKKIELPKFKDGMEVPHGYEQNVLVNYLLDTEQDAINNQLNALNLLPLPMVETKSASLVVVGTLSALLVLFGGLFFGYLILKGKNNQQTKTVAQVTNQTTQVLSETTKSSQSQPQTQQQKPQVAKSDLKIRIENGAGISGLAAKTQDFLKSLGYTVVSIDTSDQSTEATILKFKIGKKDIYSETVSNDIKSIFPAVQAGADLPSDAAYDLLITVGTSQKLQ